MKVNKNYVSDNNTYESNNPQYIVVHNTDNFTAGADASAHARAQYNGNIGTSVHYYTDDKDTVYQAAPHGRGCWHVGVNYPAVEQSVLDMVPLYLSEGEAEGVRGDIAFAQSCLETGNFGFSGSAVTLEQNNFCGMGVISNGEKGNSFDTAQMGIRAQVQHLKAYASTEELVNPIVDPRFRYVTKGAAPYVEWLGIQENPLGKGWAAGAGYGGKILAILRNIIGDSGDAGGSMEGSGNPNQPVNPLSGFVKVFYKGKDGVNVRKAPCMGDNVDQVVFDGVYTVVGISADKLWYKLKSGLFLTSDKRYVQFMEKLPEASSYMVKVEIPDLNIRMGPGTGYARTGRFTGVGAFTIVEEAQGAGASKWGLLKSYQKKRDGWISLDYVTRI